MTSNLEKNHESILALVVEDNPALLAIAVSQLKDGGISVLSASNGKEALQLLAQTKPDIIISDVEMPVMGGFDLCKSVKFDPELCHIPVALITAHVTHDFLLRGIESGADTYITRPCDPSVFIELVRDTKKRNSFRIAQEPTLSFRYEGAEYQLPSNPAHLIQLAVTAYRLALQQTVRMEKLAAELEKANRKLHDQTKEIETLLLNTMPYAVAQQLLKNGWAQPEFKQSASILFTDFKGFTKSVSQMTPSELVRNLDFYFECFDAIVRRFHLEKIKSIGDSYMIVGGAPGASDTHALDCVLAGLEILATVQKIKIEKPTGVETWDIRIGINTGPIVAGIIGRERLAYDVWGDAVNIASRLESNAPTNGILVGETTWTSISDFVIGAEHPAGALLGVRVFEILKIKPEFAADSSGLIANTTLLSKSSAMWKNLSPTRPQDWQE